MEHFSGKYSITLINPRSCKLRTLCDRSDKQVSKLKVNVIDGAMNMKWCIRTNYYNSNLIWRTVSRLVERRVLSDDVSSSWRRDSIRQIKLILQ